MPIPPNIAAMLNRGLPNQGFPPQQQQRPLPFRERMVIERNRAQSALDKANYAIKMYDASEEVRDFINKIESD